MNKIKKQAFRIKMQILIYLEQISKGRITKFTKIFYSLNDKSTRYIYNKYVQYKCIDSNLQYDFLTYLRKDSDKLVIFFNGAISSEKSQPIFQRWSWQKDLPYSSIIFSDPTILDMLQNTNIRANIGWYQGSSNNFALNTIIDIINKFSNDLQLNTSNILFYGSSAGGFTSLYASYLLAGSRVCVVNPQINIYKYHKHHSSKIFEHLNISDPKSFEFRKRLNIMDLYQHDVSKIPKYIYYKQNLLDTHHYNEHYLDFNKMMIENQKDKYLYVTLLEDERGHESIPLQDESFLDIENTFNMFPQKKVI